jgi:hypothetical protein
MSSLNKGMDLRNLSLNELNFVREKMENKLKNEFATQEIDFVVWCFVVLNIFF